MEGPPALIAPMTNTNGGSGVKEIFIRRSIWEFKNIPVEKEKTDKLLRAAMQAPSAVNQQPWEFIVVENKTSLQKLSQAMPDARPVDVISC